MFSAQGVLEARHPAEATARYWMMRTDDSLTDDHRQFEAELQREHGSRRIGVAGMIDMLGALERMSRYEAGLAAARLFVYQTLYIADQVDLADALAEERGVSLRTDYRPIERMAEVLNGKDRRVISSLPIKTQTTAYPHFAYAREQEGPYTVLHGDFAVAQAHIVAAHVVPAETVIPLSPSQ